MAQKTPNRKPKITTPPQIIHLTGKRTFLRLSGADRERFLNGQVTNDVRKARPDAAIYALITTAKGKIEADAFISPIPGEEAFLIDVPRELGEELYARLDRYIIADDAVLEDVSERYHLAHVLGDADLDSDLEVDGGTWRREANRYGPPGRDFISAGAPLFAQNPEKPGLTRDDAENLRIAHGIAAWGSELGPDVLPQEANLQDRAIDFHKGCYIGQEVISRIKSAGKVNRRLVAMAAVEADCAVRAGWELRQGGKSAGKVTSAIFSPKLGRIIALGFVKRGHEAPGTRLEAKSSENNLSSFLEIRETPLT